MRWTAEHARKCFAEGRVARLATVDGEGQPHLVPVTFVVCDDTVAIAIDHKPKSTQALKRLANIEANPRVSLLVDRYSDDWEQLWWARADGDAHVETDGATRQKALALLANRYTQYQERRPDGPVILVAVRSWTGWSYSGQT